jgi:hypothetical protein
MKKTKSIDEKFEAHNPAHCIIDLTPAACDLLALFMAEKAIHTLISKHHFPGIMYEYAEYRKERIIKLLIEIATSYRLTSWRLKGKQKENEKKSYVGLLFDGDDENGVRLSMHEACNKIIHADEILFETRKVRKKPLRYVKDQILACGTKQGKEWTIGLWIEDFCEAAINMPLLDSPFDQPKVQKDAQQKNRGDR